MQKSKESTMRISLFKELRISNIYTCESSFCGSNFGSYYGKHFNKKHLKELGRDICLSLIIYCNIETTNQFSRAINYKLKKCYSKNFNINNNENILLKNDNLLNRSIQKSHKSADYINTKT